MPARKHPVPVWPEGKRVPDWLTRAEAMDYLRIGRGTLVKWKKHYIIPTRGPKSRPLYDRHALDRIFGPVARDEGVEPDPCREARAARPDRGLPATLAYVKLLRGGLLRDDEMEALGLYPPAKFRRGLWDKLSERGRKRLDPLNQGIGRP